MIWKRAIWFLAVLCVATGTYAHKRALYNVVIDTDGGQDDFRAVTLFCASSDFNINAICSTDGVLHPNETASYFYYLMRRFGHEGIPIGVGKDRKIKKPYREHASKGWQQLFANSKPLDLPDASQVLFEAIGNEDKTTIVIALGPLGNIADLLTAHPELKKKIGLVLWFNNDENLKTGYNAETDRDALKSLDAMHIPLKIVSAPVDYSYGSVFTDGLGDLNNVYAETMSKFNAAYTGSEIQIWDELCALYLTQPNFFTESYNRSGNAVLKPIEPFYPDVLAGAILNTNKSGQGVVFNEIPASGNWIMPDLRDRTDEIVQAYGPAEFKIVAMTSEFHSHLGAYSIVGAKMGMRAMEYFHAGLDEIQVISYAGSNPPLSCLNDGLQFGTGATLGYGSIQVDTVNVRPAARIIYNGRMIEISLKPAIEQQIAADIGELVRKYGLESEQYWAQLRLKSIDYWLQWNRFEIFDIREVR